METIETEVLSDGAKKDAKVRRVLPEHEWNRLLDVPLNLRIWRRGVESAIMASKRLDVLESFSQSQICFHLLAALLLSVSILRWAGSHARFAQAAKQRRGGGCPVAC